MNRSNRGEGVIGTRNSIRIAAWAMGALLLALTPVASRAQGVGRSMDIDTDIRSAGMGGASAGVAWGDPNVWGNVASLSGVSGFHWEHSSTQLVPGLATDVWLRSNRLLVGADGVGVSLLGVPAIMDGVRLDYGTSTETDQSGNVIGQYSSYETVNGQAVAVSLPKLMDALAPPKAGAMRFSDAFDLSLGLARKRTHIDLGSYYGAAEATTYDVGVQARVSPLALLPAPAAAAGSLDLRKLALFDVGLGFSELNAVGGDFKFPSMDQSASAERTRRVGGAMRIGAHVPPLDALGPLAKMGPLTQGGPLAHVLDGFDPLIAVCLAFDHDASAITSSYTVNHTGIELTIANVITIRRGHWTDRSGDIDGSTSGWGVGIPFGPWAGFRYDRAHVPQASNSGLPDVERTGWTVWCDAVRVWSDFGSQLAGNKHAH